MEKHLNIIEEQLAKYVQILIFWQNKVNLISNSTLEQIWDRHIKDSQQLLVLLPNIPDLRIADLGSGAGFPGIVMAISNPENHYYLIESNGKKATFLRHVVTTLGLENVNVVNKRIENLPKKNHLAPFDVVVSRGLTALNKLLHYSYPLLIDGGHAIFPKGNNWQEELEETKQDDIYLKFKISTKQSQTNSQSKIFVCVKNDYKPYININRG